MNKLDMLCADFFTRKRMDHLEINRRIQGKIRHLFVAFYKLPYGMEIVPYGGNTVRDFVHNNTRDKVYLKNKQIGPCTINAINLVLGSEGLPELI